MGELLRYGTTIDYVAEKGHRFDKAYGRCVHCRVYAIDFYEDAAHGPVRDCVTVTMNAPEP